MTSLGTQLCLETNFFLKKQFPGFYQVTQQTFGANRTRVSCVMIGPTKITEIITLYYIDNIIEGLNETIQKWK